MTKNNKERSMEDVILKNISPEFGKKQTIIDTCASDNEFMKEEILNGNFSKAIAGYFNELENAKENYKKFTSKDFPNEIESDYVNSYLKVSEKLNRFYIGDK